MCVPFVSGNIYGHGWYNIGLSGHSGQDSPVHLHLKEKNNSFEDNNVNILPREDRWSSMSNWDVSLWADGVVKDITYHPPTMQYWVLSPDSSTEIPTRTHLALTTPLRTSLTNSTQMALTTLKLRAHMCPYRFYKDTPTQSLLPTNSSPVSWNWRASRMRSDTFARNWNKSTGVLSLLIAWIFTSDNHFIFVSSIQSMNQYFNLDPVVWSGEWRSVHFLDIWLII